MTAVAVRPIKLSVICDVVSKFVGCATNYVRANTEKYTENCLYAIITVKISFDDIEEYKTTITSRQINPESLLRKYLPACIDTDLIVEAEHVINKTDEMSRHIYDWKSWSDTITIRVPVHILTEILQFHVVEIETHHFIVPQRTQGETSPDNIRTLAEFTERLRRRWRMPSQIGAFGMPYISSHKCITCSDCKVSHSCSCPKCIEPSTVMPLSCQVLFRFKLFVSVWKEKDAHYKPTVSITFSPTPSLDLGAIADTDVSCFNEFGLYVRHITDMEYGVTSGYYIPTTAQSGLFDVPSGISSGIRGTSATIPSYGIGSTTSHTGYA